MRTCVIGAGLAGLAAARTLKSAGAEAVLYEKHEVVGGRVATIGLGSYVFDVGATIMAPRGKSLEHAMLQELPLEDLSLVELPIYVHEGLRASAGDPRNNAAKRYTYGSGNAHLPKLLSEGLDIRSGVVVDRLQKSEARYEVLGESFDAVILAVPAAEALRLLATVDEWRPLENVFYRPCLSVMLGYELELPPLKYHALLDPEQRHPLTWLSLESRKSSGRAPEGCSALVAQMSPQFSGAHFGSEESRIVELAADYVERLYGKTWAVPTVSGVVRWQHSQPETVTSFDLVNKVGARVVVAGDALLGSRTEHAYESGVKAANLLLA
jgi:renalase